MSILGRLRGREPVIFLHHGFCERRRSDDPENLLVEVSAFEAQLRFLLDRGWEPLTLDRWLEITSGASPRPRRSFLLTIDDALASVVDLAVPVLERLAVPGVLFAPVGLVGRTAEWLPVPADLPLATHDQLLASGLEIGLHGWDHTSMVGCGAEELDRQVRRGRDELEEWSGQRPRAFAYPFGDHDADARAAVADAGFEVGFSVFDDVGPMAVSRVDVNATDTLSSFRVKTFPGYRRLWRLLQRAAFVRRAARTVLTRGQSRAR